METNISYHCEHHSCRCEEQSDEAISNHLDSSRLLRCARRPGLPARNDRKVAPLNKRMVILSLIFLPLLSACSAHKTTSVPAEEERELVVIEVPSPAPPGVIRYCWEEPIAKFEATGPGLDSEGRWYHPYYVAVREVRMGKWRPCKPVVSETLGGREDER